MSTFLNCALAMSVAIVAVAEVFFGCIGEESCHANLDGVLRHAGEASLLQKQQHTSKRVLNANVELNSSHKGYEQLPPNLLEKMIISTPWKCDLLPTNDPRRPTCNLTLAESGLHPANRTALGNSSYDHMNSARALFPIGALPCCSTMPFCSAPACAKTKAGGAVVAPDCTKREASENVAYMKSAEMWPAYHGSGGSYELDVQKHFDILGSLLRQDGRAMPFDMVIDIGFNTGFISEKLTTRHFAKTYIAVEAFGGMKKMFESRFGNSTWKKRWFDEQVPPREGVVVPEFEFLNLAVNKVSGGTLELCHNNMWSTSTENKPCPVDMVALDDAIPARLSPKFQSAYSGAESAYMKIDVEGMDENALRGMSRMLNETRGTYDGGAPRHLVNFIQLEYCVSCQQGVKRTSNEKEYDLHTTALFLESIGFETFMMGPRYLPISHGSWDDAFQKLSEDPQNMVGGANYPVFSALHCPGHGCPVPGKAPWISFTSDLFAMRAAHPKAAAIKLALGACQQSHDFELEDSQYANTDSDISEA